MVCSKCGSGSLSVVPAEVRLFRNIPRTLSHPPMSPSPDIQICLDCGSSEFSVPQAWLAAGWLRPLGPKPVASVRPQSNVTAIAS